MFYPSELGSKDLSDYKNSKSYSYYKSGWLHPLQYHNLSGSKYCIIREERNRSHSTKDPFQKLWIILEKIGPAIARVWLVWEKHVPMLQLQCILLKLQFESVWTLVGSFTKNEVWSTETVWFKIIEYKGFCWSYQQSCPSKYITCWGTQIKGELSVIELISTKIVLPK